MSISATAQKEIWKKLQLHHSQVSAQRIEYFFDLEPDRQKRFSLTAAGLMLDYSKNLIDEKGLQLLLELAEKAQLENAISALVRGDNVNQSEKRPALHTALRNQGEGLSASLQQEILDCQVQMEDIVSKLHNNQWLGASGKAITDVINIGIGGSDLGPAMSCLALRPYDQEKVSIHFVSNLDGTHLMENIKRLDPYTTLFIVASKSFKTLETRVNAQSAKQWLIDAGISQDLLGNHFLAVTTNKAAAIDFGIAPDNILPLWDWVGGRYSVWSAVGISLALQIGMDNFKQFLAGGAAMDLHFKTAPFRKNMPVILGLLAIWYTNFFGEAARLTIPYDHYLNKLSAFLQQLEMESNGKSVHNDGTPVETHTMGAVFGEAGSNTQHSVQQFLFQGTHMFPVDYIIPAQSHNPVGNHHALLLASCIAQSRAMMVGRDMETVVTELKQQGLDEQAIEKLAPHKVIAGNKPSNILTMERVTPGTLGALIALYEHKVYVQSVIWDINAFDQWSVELGKQLETGIYETLIARDNNSYDDSTNALITYFQKHRK